MPTGFSPEIQKKIDALPEDVRKLVYSSDMDAVIQELGRKHGLHIDQLEALEAEVAALMIGITEPDEFVEGIVDTLSVDKAKAEIIAKDVDEKLFVKIRESMKKVYEEGKKEVAPAPSAPAAVATPPAASTPVVQKSVVMPSAQASTPTPPAPTIPSAPQVSTPKPSILPAKAPDLHPAELMMTEKTVQVAPAPTQTPAPTTVSTVPPKPTPPAPQPYKADPYREPVE